MFFKQNLLISILFFTMVIDCFNGNCQIQYDRKSHLLNEEISAFINRIDKESIKKNRIFIIYIYENDTSQNSFCFSMSYIYNTYEYNNFSPNYFFNFNEDIITIINDDTNEIRIFSVFKPIRIDKIQEEIIINKLYDGITYRPMAMQFCYENNFFKLTVFQNGDWVPVEESIYNNYIKKGKTKN